MIKGLDHAALSVGNLDRSLAFYRDLIGFEVSRIVEAGSTMRLGEVVGLPGCRARIAHLVRGSTMLELLEYEQTRGRPVPADRTQADRGCSHVAFASTDTRADYTRLRDAGVAFLSPPVEFRPGVWIAYFRGPDGEICELRET